MNVHIHQFQPGRSWWTPPRWPSSRSSGRRTASWSKAVPPGPPRGRGDPSRNPERRFQIALQLPRHRLRRRQFDEGGGCRKPRSVTITASTFHNQAAANLPGSFRSRSRSPRFRRGHDAEGRSMPTRRGAACRSITSRPKTSLADEGNPRRYRHRRRVGPARIGPRGLDRFVRTNKHSWRVLTPPEWDQIRITSPPATFPRPQPCGANSAVRQAFAKTRQVFVVSTDFFRLFRFEG